MVNRLYYIILVSLSIFGLILINNIDLFDREDSLNIENFEGEISIQKSIIMYESIEKYSELYDVPKHIAYNIAYRETTYRGPFDFKYDPEKISPAGALGPMQIMPATANSRVFTDTFISNSDLMNIDLNVKLSMMILRRSYEKHKDWTIACGKYNTGKAIINEYAIYCSKNKNYTKNWVELKIKNKKVRD